jgi:hypothetical protein
LEERVRISKLGDWENRNNPIVLLLNCFIVKLLWLGIPACRRAGLAPPFAKSGVGIDYIKIYKNEIPAKKDKGRVSLA